jgi:hypothetical protein
MIKITIMMGLECKRDTMEGEGKWKRCREVKRIKACYLYMYRDCIQKPTKYCF